MSKKLLLADDSITIQKVIGITFANEEYELDLVDNGDDALEMARTARPDLILADVFMPGKNGYELCSAVKREPGLSAVPVLLLTGTFEPFDESRAQECGADGWIAKPFESQALIDKVEELLAKSAEAPAAATKTDAPAAVSAGVPEPSREEASGEVEPEEDIFAGEDDIWAELSDLEDEKAAGFSPANAAAGHSAEDELWEIAPPREEEAGSEVWSSLESAPASAGGDEIDELADEDILPLDEADILEEEDLEVLTESGEDLSGRLEGGGAELNRMDEAYPPTDETAAQGVPSAEGGIGGFEEEFAFSLDDERTVPEEGAGETSTPRQAEVAEGTWGLPEEEISFEEAPEFEMAAEEAGGVSGWGDEVRSEEIGSAEGGASEVLPPEDFPEMPLQEKPEPASDAPAAPIERQVGALSEEELTQIVEKVAGSVIERLAGTLLEKIAWEVVPDLAENMVREEIRKIKEGVR